MPSTLNPRNEKTDKWTLGDNNKNILRARHRRLNEEIILQ
jgi:hypothetical protein